MNKTDKIETFVRMDEELYHSNPALSASALKALRKSPAHLKHNRETPTAPTPALTFGRLFHALTLEQDDWDTRFAVAPDCDRRTKAGKQQWEEFVDASGGLTIVTTADIARASAMRNAVMNHGVAREIIEANGLTEMSSFWERDGIPCKMRADKIDTKNNIVIDLKTCLDASPHAFAGSIMKYGYHVQAAWYLDRVRDVIDKSMDFLFVAIEKNPPHIVAVYRINDQSVDVGRREIEELLDLFKYCTSRNEWGGYSDDVEEIGLPKWAVPTEEVEE